MSDPSITSGSLEGSGRKHRGFRSLLPYLWPRDSWEIRGRVILALAALAASKIANVYIPILYRDADDLRRLMTPNGKIQGRKRTGMTAKEQRMVAQAIKRARFMALLPYTSATL